MHARSMELVPLRVAGVYILADSASGQDMFANVGSSDNTKSVRRSFLQRH